jgi:spermidine synthase
VQVPLLAIFFLSGFAALLYQVVWQRMLALFSGSDIYSSTLIVAAFMAGLGVGHLAGGHLADRFSRRRTLLLFAASELAIALFSVLSPALYHDFLYQRLGALGFPQAAVAGVLFASLLWPTFFMGLSLPLLARASTEHVDRAALSVGALYGVNTLGAALGALAATWWLLPQFGMVGALLVGAVLNVVCAVGVIPLALHLRGDWRDEDRTQPALLRDLESPIDNLGILSWAAIYAFSGFLALSLEIVWFRLLGVIVKSTSFTFGTLLAFYLAGLGAGSVVGARYAVRVERPAVAFLALQTAVGVCAAVLFALLIGVADDVAFFREYFATYDPLDVRERVSLRFVMLYVGVPIFLILLPTFLMGASFPVLQRVVQTDFSRLGRRVGLLLVANIVGSATGALLTGWLALTVLGAAGTMRAIAAMSGVFALALWHLCRRKPPAFWNGPVARYASIGAVGASVLLAVLAVPDGATLWARLHGTSRDRIVVGEDATGLSVLRLEQSAVPMETTVFANGIGQSSVPYVGDIHTALGLLPAFIHPNPKSAVVIGLGSGDTVYATAGRAQIERIDSIEIIKPQLDTLRSLSARNPYPALHRLLADPRIAHLAGDGRAALMHSRDRFDIIEADALRPRSAYSGNLFSEGYFTLVRSRLRPGGLAVTWSPTKRVQSTFLKVFPYVLIFPGILMGSAEPIAFDYQQVVARLADAQVREHYSAAGIDVDRLIRSYLTVLGQYTPEFNRLVLTDINTDLFPKDEFDLSP